MSTFVSVVILVGVLGFALVRPWGLPEAVGAVPGAGLVVLLGLVSWQDAGRELVVLGPTVGFLAAVLTLAHLADDAGVFRYAGWVAGRVSRGSPRRLLGVLFVIASAVTAVLSLDATVVLLTPVVLATAMRMRVRAKPHLYACTHLANSASLLLPVSNLTTASVPPGTPRIRHHRHGAPHPGQTTKPHNGTAKIDLSHIRLIREPSG